MPTHDDADQLYKQAVEAAGRGDHFKAKELFEDALELYREVPGAEKDQAHCLYSLATTLLILGKPAQAEPLYRQALTLYQTAPTSERNQAQCLDTPPTSRHRLEKLDEAAPPLSSGTRPVSKHFRDRTRPSQLPGQPRQRTTPAGQTSRRRTLLPPSTHPLPNTPRNRTRTGHRFA